jgi:serine/threonine protein kinase
MTTEIASFQNGRCQVLRKLGEGGKGIVFLCQDSLLRRRVAIKLIKGEALDAEGLLRFQREVQAMASLVHPNVVTVFDIGQEGGRGEFETRPYLVLELMEGGDVERLIEKAPASAWTPPPPSASAGTRRAAWSTPTAMTSCTAT